MVRVVVSADGSEPGQGSLIRNSGPDVRHGVTLSGFARTWLVGWFHFSGWGAETH